MLSIMYSKKLNFLWKPAKWLFQWIENRRMVAKFLEGRRIRNFLEYIIFDHNRMRTNFVSKFASKCYIYLESKHYN